MRPAHCIGCPYKADSPHCIGSIGNPESPIVIVGEAPGGEEINNGRPFIGPSGKLLYRALARAGITNPEEDCFITNALSCRPPINVPPSFEAIQSCRDRLMSEISLHPRSMVLTLGNSALRAVCNGGNFKISQERGHPNSSSPGDYIVFPTWHPAAVLRNGDRWPQMRDDIRNAIAQARGEQPPDPGITEWELITTDFQAKAVVYGLRNATHLAADIETSGLDPRRNYITYLGIAYAKNKVVIFPRALIYHLLPLFLNPNIKWIWHNGKFDTSFLHNLREDGCIPNV